MNKIFIGILNNGYMAGILILAVIVTRVIIRKAPKWINCLLWGMVALKLVLPFSMESVLSLIPSKEPVAVDIEQQDVPKIDTGVKVINEAVNPVLENKFSYTDELQVSVSPIQKVLSVMVVVWGIGVAVMILYSLISYFILRRKVAVSRRISNNVYICDGVVSPFILGILRPHIYIPSGMDENVRECVLEHEKAHLKRWDHIWKPLGFLILSVYWFNPLCWCAYILLCKDIELACDEKVTKDRDNVWKAAYCQALLDCNVKRCMIAACPVAFGEVSVKARVKSVISYKKPVFWVMLTAVAACIIVTVCFMTNPKSNDITMEKLIKITTEDGWYERQEKGNVSLWEKYTNLIAFKREDEEESLVKVLRAPLEDMGGIYELQVYYWPEDTAEANWHKTGDIEMIAVINNLRRDVVCLYPNNTDISDSSLKDFISKKYELPDELTASTDNIQSSKLKTKVILDEYKMGMFLGFNGCLFESESYIPPAHGEWVEEARYALGGVGVSDLSDYSLFATFTDGKLTAYDYTDNHMSCEKITAFAKGEYSACLYRYEVDLITASEEDILEEGESETSDLWVVFFTKGEEEPLYMKFFNSEYYSMSDAMNGI